MSLSEKSLESIRTLVIQVAAAMNNFFTNPDDPIKSIVSLTLMNRITQDRSERAKKIPYIKSNVLPSMENRSASEFYFISLVERSIYVPRLIEIMGDIIMTSRQELHEDILLDYNISSMILIFLHKDLSKINDITPDHMKLYVEGSNIAQENLAWNETLRMEYVSNPRQYLKRFYRKILDLENKMVWDNAERLVDSLEIILKTKEDLINLRNTF